MTKKHIVVILSLAIMLFCTGLTTASAKPVIKNIRFESTTATADRVIFELNGPYLPTGNALPGVNPRVYFDFPDVVPGNKVKNNISANGNFVKKIRHAYHKGPKQKTRVVFDLVANQKIDFKQDFDKNTNTLIITLYLAGTEPGTVAAVSPAEPEPVVAQKPAPPEAPAKDVGKKVQPIEDVALAAPQKPEEAAPEPELQVPPKAQEFIPAQPEAATQEAQPEAVITEKKPAPAPEPAAQPEPATQEAQPEAVITEQKTAPVPQPAAQPKPQPEPAPQEKTVQVANIPPAVNIPDNLEVPLKEATVIQPMSEVGIQDEGTVEDTAPVLYSIEFEPNSKRGEMISFKLDGFHPPVVFGIEEDIPRIVCFFKNATAGNELRDMIGTNGQYVKNIKIGKYRNPDNIRVILELVPGNNYDLQQIFFKDDKVFMMIINKAGKQITSQGKQ